MAFSPDLSNPLPHAPIGMVLGLVQHLAEAPGGREDVYKLGGPLGYELDDLLPVTHAAKALGLVTVQKGDIHLTPEGRSLAEADEPARKEWLAVRLGTLPLVAAIRAALEAAPGGRVPRRRFRAALEPHFSPGEIERQLQTALDWARYGELFDCDADADEFVRTAPGS